MPNTHSIDFELSSSQSLTITDAAQTGLDITTDFSMEAWVNLEQLPSTAGAAFDIMSKLDAGATGAGGYIFAITTSDKLQIYWEGTENSGHSRMDMDEAFDSGDLGNWIHVAVTVDVSVPSAEFYKNGVAKSDTVGSSTRTNIIGNANDFFVSRKYNADSEHFDGLIDELRIWNDIRTGTEILDNYQKELVGDEAGLVAYWKLNNNSLDETSNDNDLTQTNSPVFSTSVPFSGAAAATTTSVMLMGLGS